MLVSERWANINARQELLDASWKWIERLWLCVGAMLPAVAVQWVGVFTRFYVLNILGVAVLLAAFAGFVYCVARWWPLARAIKKLEKEYRVNEP